MVMPHNTRVWTREEVWALPDDGKRYELIAGELLVSPSPGGMHQRALARLYDLVAPYVRSHGLGETLFSPADLQLQRGDISQPDLFVIPPGWDGRDWEACGVPLLIAEILSSSTARYDRITKRSRYQQSGVGDYWIVDIDAQVFERWTPSDARPEVLAETISWQPEGARNPLIIDIEQYFREVTGR